MSKLCQKFEKAGTVIGKRWVNLIIFELLTGPKRFKEIQDQVEISPKMLSERLKYLEEQNILSRKLYDETPIRVEYELTKKGYALKPIMEALSTWSQDWYQ